MPAHLITPRRKIANRQKVQSVEQVTRFDSERRTQILEAENIAEPGTGVLSIEPISDFDKITPALAVLFVQVSQIASNRVFQNGQHKFQLALDDVISPDHVDVLSRQQESSVD